MKHKLRVLKTRGPDKFDPHEDPRDAGFHSKPSYQYGHYTLHHKSQKRNELPPSNSFAQSPVENKNSLPLVHSTQRFSEPTLHSLQHRNHNNDPAFTTPFVSSSKYATNKNTLYDSFR